MQDRGAEAVNILMQEIALSISFNSQLDEHSFNKAFMKNENGVAEKWSTAIACHRRHAPAPIPAIAVYNTLNVFDFQRAL